MLSGEKPFWSKARVKAISYKFQFHKAGKLETKTNALRELILCFGILRANLEGEEGVAGSTKDAALYPGLMPCKAFELYCIAKGIPS